MKTYKTKKGYYYKEYKNGKKKRISRIEYDKLRKKRNKKQKGGGTEIRDYIFQKYPSYKNLGGLLINNDNKLINNLTDNLFPGFENQYRKIFDNKYDGIFTILSSNNTNNTKLTKLKKLIENNNNNMSVEEGIPPVGNNNTGIPPHRNNNTSIPPVGNNTFTSISQLLNCPEDVYFTSFMEFLSTRSGRTNTEVLIQEYIQNNQIHTLTINGKHTLQFKIDKNNMLGFGSYGYVYDIPDHDVCIKFMFVNENQSIEGNKDLNLYLEGITKSKGLLPIKDLLLRETTDSKSKSVFYFNGTKKRVRVYLMKKISFDFKELSHMVMNEVPFVLYEPNIIKYFLKKLMIQIDLLMKNSGTFEGAYNYIHKAQIFDFKPANIGIITGTVPMPYLIDIDGYLYHKKRRVNKNKWISSFPPIEFYKNYKTLEDGQHITVTDLEKEGKEYYATGKHISWMLGIVVYQMFCYFVKVIVLPKNQNKNKRMIYNQSLYGKPSYFNFINYEKHILKNCTETNNLFTSLDNFIDALPEPYKSKWKNGNPSPSPGNSSPSPGNPSFLDEIKSCLYFDVGIYDESEEPLTWSPKGLDDRRPFYNEDGSINFF